MNETKQTASDIIHPAVKLRAKRQEIALDLLTMEYWLNNAKSACADDMGLGTVLRYIDKLRAVAAQCMVDNDND